MKKVNPAEREKSHRNNIPRHFAPPIFFVFVASLRRPTLLLQTSPRDTSPAPSTHEELANPPSHRYP